MKNAETLDAQVARLIRPEIQGLHAYVVPDSSGMLKLDSMENPYGWPEELLAPWLEFLSSAQLNRYPDPQGVALKKQLRHVMQIPEDMDILLGNGSDEIIQLLAMALAKPGRSLLAPEPGFVMYRMIAEFVGLDYIGVPLLPNFELDIDTMLEKIKTHQPELIFLAVPNNPTGNNFSADHIEKILTASEGLVVVDEAYMAFTDSNYLPMLKRFDNLVVMRTLSKVGLAGLRLGFLVGRPQWLAEFDKLRLPYNINVLTLRSAEFALQHFDCLQQQTAQIREQRAQLIDELQQLADLQVWPSEANFVLVRTQEGRARPAFEALKQRGILIKCLDGGHPLLQDCLRLTVGTAEQNREMITALTEILAQ